MIDNNQESLVLTNFAEQSQGDKLKIFKVRCQPGASDNR